MPGDEQHNPQKRRRAAQCGGTPSPPVAVARKRWFFSVAVPVVVAVGDETRDRVEKQPPVVLPMTVEVKHLFDRVGDAVKRAFPDALPFELVVFNESQNRSLIRYRVIHKIPLCPRRNDQKGLPRAITAPALSVCRAGLWPR